MTSSDKVSPAPRHQEGLTLMEVMVALVILSATVSLLWQALAQVSRVEMMLEAGTLQGQRATVRIEWLRHLVEALVPLAETEADTFKGDGASFNGLSTEVPGWPATSAAPVWVALEHDARSNQGRLVLRTGRNQATGPALPSLLLMEWAGGPGSFEYQDEDGQWHPRWPATALQPGQRRLPLRVALRTGSEEWPLLVIAPRTSGMPRPTRRAMEQL